MSESFDSDYIDPGSTQRKSSDPSYGTPGQTISSTFTLTDPEKLQTLRLHTTNPIQSQDDSSVISSNSPKNSSHPKPSKNSQKFYQSFDDPSFPHDVLFQKSERESSSFNGLDQILSSNSYSIGVGFPRQKEFDGFVSSDSGPDF